MFWLPTQFLISVERPSDKSGNSYSHISWVTHGNREEFRVIHTQPAAIEQCSYITYYFLDVNSF